MLLALVIGRYATVPMASEELDKEGKAFLSSSDHSNIYLSSVGNVGAYTVFSIALDGQLIGSAYHEHMSHGLCPPAPTPFRSAPPNPTIK